MGPSDATGASVRVEGRTSYAAQRHVRRHTSYQIANIGSVHVGRWLSREADATSPTASAPTYRCSVSVERTATALSSRKSCNRACRLAGSSRAEEGVMPPSGDHPVGRDAERSELKRAFCSSLSEL